MNRRMLSRLWKFVRNAVVAVCGLAIVVALLPSKARSQLGLDPCCAMIWSETMEVFSESMAIASSMSMRLRCPGWAIPASATGW